MRSKIINKRHKDAWMMGRKVIAAVRGFAGRRSKSEIYQRLKNESVQVGTVRTRVRRIIMCYHMNYGVAKDGTTLRPDHKSRATRLSDTDSNLSGMAYYQRKRSDFVLPLCKSSKTQTKKKEAEERVRRGRKKASGIYKC